MGDPKDHVATAIEATNGPAPVQMHQIQVTLSSTGRPVVVVVPADLTETERLDLAGWICTGGIVASLPKRSAIIVPTLVRPS